MVVRLGAAPWRFSFASVSVLRLWGLYVVLVHFPVARSESLWMSVISLRAEARAATHTFRWTLDFTELSKPHSHLSFVQICGLCSSLARSFTLSLESAAVWQWHSSIKTHNEPWRGIYCCDRPLTSPSPTHLWYSTGNTQLIKIYWIITTTHAHSPRIRRLGWAQGTKYRLLLLRIKISFSVKGDEPLYL